MAVQSWNERLKEVCGLISMRVVLFSMRIVLFSMSVALFSMRVVLFSMRVVLFSMRVYKSSQLRFMFCSVLLHLQARVCRTRVNSVVRVGIRIIITSGVTVSVIDVDQFASSVGRFTCTL